MLGRRSWRILRRMALGLASGLVVGHGISCQPNEGGDGTAESTKKALQVGPSPDGGAFEQFEGTGTQRLEGYVYRRFFPSTEPSRAGRVAALDQLYALRTAQGYYNYDPASDSCGGMCSDLQACFSGSCAEPCLPFGDPNFPCVNGTATITAAGCYCTPSGGGSGGPGLPASGCGWTPIGPTNVSGRVNSLVFDPDDPNRLVAGTVGGVWVSPNKGRSWQRIVLPGVAGTQISHLAFNTFTRELFAGVTEPSRGVVGDGVWMSTSKGDAGTWAKISNAEIDSAKILRIRVQPVANGNVYVATSKGLFVGSHPAGAASWSWGLLAGMDANLDDVVVDFTVSPPIFYVAARAGGPKPGVWRHNGTGWSLIHGGIAQVAGISTAESILRAGLALGPPGNTAYLRITSSSSTVMGLYKITNSTNVWTAISTTGVVVTVVDSMGVPTMVPDNGGTLYTLLAVDPNPANAADPIIYMGTQYLWARSPNGTWNIINTPPAQAPAPNPPPPPPVTVHVDQHALAFDPSNSRILYSGNDGGVYRSTDTGLPGWQWRESSHGMQNAQFYRISSQQGAAALVGGGFQDQGFGATFGNRTWYNFPWCDGFEIGADAENSSLLHAGCQGGVFAFTNPVYYSPGGGSTVASTVSPTDVVFATISIGIPTKLVVDPTVPKSALASGALKPPLGQLATQQFILKTTNAVNWQALSPALAVGTRITAIGISSTPAPAAKYYYVGVQPSGSGQGALVYASPDAGATWSSPVQAGTTWINAFAVSPTDPKTAWMASRDGSVRQTKDGGTTWTELLPNDASGTLPPASAVTGIIATVGLVTNSSTTLFAATNVGVFQGSFLPNGKVNWFPFDFGLPDGIDVNDIQANLQSRTLVIGTWGHGAYRYVFPPVGSEETCRGVQLLIRDNVFDQGRSPSLNGVPDPEWPQPIDRNVTPIFYKPNETDRVYFWESTDIRTEVPTKHDTMAYNCPWAPGIGCPVDSVEFDGCPIQVGACPLWALRDTDPVRSPLPPQPPVTTNFYVQVTNNGLATANKVRVVTLIADASAGVPPLPTNFWSQTVNPGVVPEPPGSACGTLAAGPWAMVGCKVLDKQVGPATPEVVQFPFAVPVTTTSHSCMVAIVDSAADPVVPGSNPANVEVLAQTERHVAMRNLHVIDGPSAAAASTNEGAGTSTAPGIPFSGLATLKVPNRWNTAGSHQVLFSRSGMEQTGRLAFLLPAGKSAPGLPPKCGVTANSSTAIAISVPKGLVAGKVALSANGALDIADRAVVSGAGGVIANAGSGQLTVGADARVGTVWSIGNVFLRERATVAGDVNLGGTLTQQNPITIQGGVHQMTLGPADIFSWTITWPTVSRGNRDIQPGQQVTELPGRLGNVSVKSNATLKLTSGVYYMDALTFEPQSTLLLDQTAGPTTIYARQGFTFRGADRTVSNAPPDLLLVAVGSNDAVVETSFTGTIVAPTARLTLGSNGGTFVGSYFARDLVLRPDVKILEGISTAIVTLPACRALTTSEKSAATAAGLSTVLYPVMGTELNQELPIPFDQTWTIGLRYDSGTGRTGTASRFRVISLYQNQVMGGNTFLLRQ